MHHKLNKHCKVRHCDKCRHCSVKLKAVRLFKYFLVNNQTSLQLDDFFAHSVEHNSVNPPTKPVSCVICGQSLASPQELEAHGLFHLQVDALLVALSNFRPQYTDGRRSGQALLSEMSIHSKDRGGCEGAHGKNACRPGRQPLSSLSSGASSVFHLRVGNNGVA